ncbi:MAG TPA: FxDxF family PEP-CTERM protein [Caulobacteraceae bacterium]|nr:FxDxF family PEP-CTERM protein [Caulobacteraceae bacterium]
MKNGVGLFRDFRNVAGTWSQPLWFIERAQSLGRLEDNPMQVRLKYLAAVAAAATMMGVASAASADTYSFTITQFGALQTGGFNHSAPAGPLNDSAQFFLNSSGSLSSTVDTILLMGVANVTFTKVYLDIDDLAHQFQITTGATGVDTASFHGLDGFPVTAGLHTIHVIGNIAGDGGTYEGSVNVIGAAVPEPATWAMMILGMGMVGAGLRMRRKLGVQAV